MFRWNPPLFRRVICKKKLRGASTPPPRGFKSHDENDLGQGQGQCHALIRKGQFACQSISIVGLNASIVFSSL